MRITKETLREAFKAGIRFHQGEMDFITHFNPSYKKPNFDEWYKEISKKKVVAEVLDRDWADYRFERPAKDNFYVTKVKWKGKIEEVADWWNGYCFMYNNDLVTHWKRK